MATATPQGSLKGIALIEPACTGGKDMAVEALQRGLLELWKPDGVHQRAMDFERWLAADQTYGIDFELVRHEVPAACATF